jgi:serine/threonine protein kinase
VFFILFNFILLYFILFINFCFIPNYVYFIIYNSIIFFILFLVNLEIKYLYKEIEALKRLDHKYIIKLWSFCTDSNENIVLILEYAEGGSLRGK